MIPMACLIATVFTMTSLNKSGELVALYANGTSLARVSAPILIIVGVLSTLSFWMSDQILPKMAQKKNYVFFVEIKKTPGLYSTVKTNKIWYRTGNILFNIRSLNPQARVAQGLTLYYFNPSWDLVQLVTAEQAKIKSKIWELSNGKVTLFTDQVSYPLTKMFRKKNIVMKEGLMDIQTSHQTTSTLSVKQLKRFIKRNKESGLDTLHYEIDYHGKFSFAFAAFVMSLMGIPFSVKRERSGGTFASAGMCLGLTFLYWAFYSSALTMGKYGALPPIIAAWLPNLVVTGGSVYLLMRLKR